jgi:hypothetical protein
MWVQEITPGRVRVGFDALTADTYGALAQLAMAHAGTSVHWSVQIILSGIHRWFVRFHGY